MVTARLIRNANVTKAPIRPKSLMISIQRFDFWFLMSFVHPTPSIDISVIIVYTKIYIYLYSVSIQLMKFSFWEEKRNKILIKRVFKRSISSLR